MKDQNTSCVPSCQSKPLWKFSDSAQMLLQPQSQAKLQQDYRLCRMFCHGFLEDFLPWLVVALHSWPTAPERRFCMPRVGSKIGGHVKRLPGRTLHKPPTRLSSFP